MESNLQQPLRFFNQKLKTGISTQTVEFTNFSALFVTRRMRDKQEDLCIKDIKNNLGTSKLEISYKILLSIY
jgi:hypothetical protein